MHFSAPFCTFYKFGACSLTEKSPYSLSFNLNSTQSNMSTVTLSSLAQKLVNTNGNFVGLLWHRPMKTYKGTAAVVTKTVRTTVRVGLEYDNREVVKEARADGTLPAENAGLNGMEWVQYPVVLRSLKTGKAMIRVYPVKNADGSPRSCKTVYRINGVRVTKQMVQEICLASEFSKGTPTECFSVPADAIQQVKLAGEIYSRRNAKTALVSLSGAAVVPV
jgi:hypothetical protein